MRIYPVFYVALLELVLYKVPTIVLDLSKDNELIEYKVEDIINRSIRDS